MYNILSNLAIKDISLTRNCVQYNVRRVDKKKMLSMAPRDICRRAKLFVCTLHTDPPAGLFLISLVPRTPAGTF